MNKKIILFSLMAFNSAFAQPWSWHAIQESIRQNSGKWGAGLVTLIALSTAAAYKFVFKTKEKKPEVVVDERQKFLSMLTKAIEGDIFRLECMLKYNRPDYMAFDALHVWEQGTKNAADKFPDLHNYARNVKTFEGYLRYVQDVHKAKNVLTAMRDAVKAARNQQ